MGRIAIPDFELTGFYYPDIFQDLITYKRRYLPELTAEYDGEPLIEIYKAISWVAHIRSTQLDMTAKEAFWKTLQLRASLESHLAWMGEELPDATPASVDIIGRVTTRVGPESLPLELVRNKSLFYTGSDTDNDIPTIVFETQNGVSLQQANDRIGSCLAYKTAGNVVTDHTESAQKATSYWTPEWTPAARDALYLGHQDLMFQRVDVSLAASSPSTQILDMVVAYYEGYKNPKTPDLVRVAGDEEPGQTAIGGNEIEFYIPSALGLKNRAGTTVRVQHAETGVVQDVVSTYSAGAPQSVSAITGGLRLALNNFFPGAYESPIKTVVVRNIATRSKLELEVKWNGTTNYVDTNESDDPYLGQAAPGSTTASAYWVDAGPNKVKVTSFLGQTTPSKDPNLYYLYIPFQEVENLVDESDGLSTGAGERLEVSWDLPQNMIRNWEKFVASGDPTGEAAYWIQWRVVAVGPAPQKPRILQISPAGGEQWLLVSALQGETFVDLPAGSGTGQPGQIFAPSKSPTLVNSLRVFVTEDDGFEREYVRAEGNHFFDSGPGDRVYTTEQDEFGEVTGFFGDGTNGKSPPLGTDNIRLIGRQMDDFDGNIPAGTVIAGGTLSYVDKVTNPRAAFGWAERGGIDEFAIAQAKLSYPRKLRSLDNRAIAPSDFESHATKVRSAVSGQLFCSRAKALELGQKLTQLTVVAPGGGGLSSESLTTLSEYFNGSEEKKIKGKIIANQKIVAKNYRKRFINLTVACRGGSQTAIRTALLSFLQPEARDPDDDTQFLWDFGEGVTEFKVKSVIAALTGIKPSKVTLGGKGGGALSGTAGSTLITGSGTNFSYYLNRGDWVMFGTTKFTVNSIVSPTTFIAEEEAETSFSGKEFSFEMVEIPLANDELPYPGNITVSVG